MHLTPPASLGMISTSLAWVSNVGGFFMGPFFAASWKMGLRVGVLGLPYFIVAAGLGVCCVALLVITVPGDRLAGEGEQGVDERDGGRDEDGEATTR